MKCHHYAFKFKLMTQAELPKPNPISSCSPTGGGSWYNAAGVKLENHLKATLCWYTQSLPTAGRKAAAAQAYAQNLLTRSMGQCRKRDHMRLDKTFCQLELSQQKPVHTSGAIVTCAEWWPTQEAKQVDYTWPLAKT